MEFFGEENMEESLIVAFARFEENQREVRDKEAQVYRVISSGCHLRVLPIANKSADM